MKLFASLLCLVAIVLATTTVSAATIDSEASLRTAIDAATNGAVIIISGNIELQSPIRVTNSLTFRNDSTYPFGYAVGGRFAGELFQIAADGITFEGLRFYGSLQTDGFRMEKNLILRDCYVTSFRDPATVPDNFWEYMDTRIRLERVTVTANQGGFESYNLEATNCTFSSNARNGAGGQNANIDRCVFEKNGGDGLLLTYGIVKNCVFRF
jgi:hypothetical protein